MFVKVLPCGTFTLPLFLFPLKFYGSLSQQQNVIQDFVMTATYHRAILQNHTDSRDKVVLDAGCGSGILSFFAVQAGAWRVYAVDASSVAQYAEDPENKMVKE